MPDAQFALIAIAGFAAGAVNALAGGGTLISFPVLTALGVPPIAANITNTVALCPGYLGATWAQRKDFAGQSGRLWFAMPAGAIGGLAGGILLLHTDPRMFRTLVPFLILFASLLLGSQDLLRRWLVNRAGARGAARSHTGAAAVAVALAGVYGGYFGAGLSVIVLAVLGLLIDDTLTRLNALKQTIAFSANIMAGVFFFFSGHVIWPIAGAMAAGALAGGAIGGRLASKVRPKTLRAVVVIVGVVAAVIYLLR